MPDYSFEADLPLLYQAAKGITDTCQAVSDDDVSDWLPGQGDLGSDVVWTEVDTFGKRWDLGLNNLREDVEEAGHRLMNVVATYDKYDKSSTETMKASYGDLAGLKAPTLGGR